MNTIIAKVVEVFYSILAHSEQILAFGALAVGLITILGSFQVGLNKFLEGYEKMLKLLERLRKQRAKRKNEKNRVNNQNNNRNKTNKKRKKKKKKANKR